MYALEVIKNLNAKKPAKTVPFAKAHARIYADENGGAILYPPVGREVYLYPRLAESFFGNWYAADTIEDKDEVVLFYARLAGKMSVNRPRK